MNIARLTIALVGLLSFSSLAAHSSNGQTLPASSAQTTRTSSTLSGSAACEKIPQPHVGALEVAPDSRRVDLCLPRFSNPTQITNPVFPVSSQDSVLLVGTVDDKPFRTEVTLLDHTRVIPWAGMQVEVAVSQYVAFLGGRIHEVAYDLYAQDDDGNVWYFGEDVYNWLGGAIGDTHGTWTAGIDGPAAMIMPAEPRPGQVYRPENIPGLVFEEVTVTKTDQQYRGPLAIASGAVVVSELHMDGQRERKTFAPGYGEFFTSGGGDTEALAMAVPTDAAKTDLPAPVTKLNTAATSAFDAAMRRDLGAIDRAKAAARTAWQAVNRREVPRLLRPPLNRAVNRLDTAAGAGRAAQAAIDLARVAQDLRLRYVDTDSVDLLRFDTWLAQMLLDTRRRDLDAVRGDVFAIDYLRDRVRDSFDERERAAVDLALEELLDAINDEDLGTVRDVASALRRRIA